MRLVLSLLCFFLSGFAGLLYQVCWVRKATLVFGSTTFALSSVLAIFFLGLALGSHLFGRISPRVARPLRLFAVMEASLALLALASLWTLEAVDSVYGHVYRSLGGFRPMLFLVRLLLMAVVILPPTVLMGGTLPLFCRHFVETSARIARWVGGLYGVNTLGAAVGCATAGFLLIPGLGVEATVVTGASINLLVAITVILGVARPKRGRLHRVRARRESRTAAREQPVLTPTQRAVFAALFLLTGFVALGNEVLWTRYLALLIDVTVHTYTVTLTVVLVGIVLGSLLASWWFDRVSSRGRLFGGLQILSGLSVLTVMMMSPGAWRSLGGGMESHFLLLLPSSILSGASFPLAMRLMIDDPRQAGPGVGRWTAVHTLGGIAGSLTVGFVALPALGLEASLRVLSLTSLVIGIASWLLFDTARRRSAAAVSPARSPAGTAALVGASSLAWWWIVPLAMGTRVPADFLAAGRPLLGFREGIAANVAVVESRGIRQMEIDRWWQGEDRKEHQFMAAHVPMLIHPAPRSVLLVGVGAGQTASRFLLYDIDRLECVDIEPAVFGMIEAFFDATWMRDERVILLSEDGRNHLAHAASTYDVISLELGQIFRPGVAGFYTREFYEDVRRRLNPGGIVSQFLPLPFLTVEQFRSAVGTFLDVFPQSLLWYNTSEVLLLGTVGDTFQVCPARLLLLGKDEIREDLRYSYWGGEAHWLSQPTWFLAGMLCGPAGLEALSEGAEILSDDRPVLEYGVVGAHAEQALEVPTVEAIRRHLDSFDVLLGDPHSGRVADCDAVFEAEADSILREIPRSSLERARLANVDDMVTAALLRKVEPLRRSGDLESLIELLRRALESNPQNALAHRQLGDAYVLQRRFEAARDAYTTSVSIRGYDGLARRNLATVLHRLGELDAAIEQYHAAIELRPEDALAHGNLGAALADAGRTTEALISLREALRLRPEYRDARENLARLEASLTGSNQRSNRR